jgi:hypothetical protein
VTLQLTDVQVSSERHQAVAHGDCFVNRSAAECRLFTVGERTRSAINVIF